MKQMGFARVVEVVGADLCAIEEAKDFMEKIPAEQNYMATSCCPADEERIPRLQGGFVDPCAAKELEAIRADIRSDVDFVLTFEELNGMFEAKQIDFESQEESDVLNEGSALGCGFAVSGGIAGAVTKLIQKDDPNAEVVTAHAEGLRECCKLMALVKAGKYDGYLLEGRDCPGGCIAGAGTLLSVELAATVVGRYHKETQTESPLESPYRDRGETMN